MQAIKFIFILLVANHFSYAQVGNNWFDVEQSTLLKGSKRSSLHSIIGSNDTHIYTLNKYQHGSSTFIRYDYTLEKYDQGLDLIKSLKFDLKYRKEKLTFEKLVYLNNKLSLITSFKHHNHKKNYLFIQTVDKATLSPNDDLEKIAEIDYQNMSKYYAGDFEIQFSNDSSKILIFHTISDKKNLYKTFGFTVLDSDFNLQWEKQVTLPYKSKLFDIESFEISSNGAIYILGKKYSTRKIPLLKENPNFNYRLLSYFEEEEQVKEYVVDFAGKFLNDLQIVLTETQDVICAGYYSSNGVNTVAGTCYLKIDGETKEVITEKLQEFSVEVLTQGLSDREEKKLRNSISSGTNYELSNYELDDAILNVDGSVTLIGEQIGMDIGTLQSTTSSSTTMIRYYYNNILVVRLTLDGVIENVDVIEKRQKTVNDGGLYSSYTHVKYDDDLYVLFNDHPKNITYDGSTKLHIYSGLNKGQTVAVKIDSLGNQERKVVFSSESNFADFIPSESKQLNSKDLMIYGKRKKRIQLSKISIK